MRKTVQRIAFFSPPNSLSMIAVGRSREWLLGYTVRVLENVDEPLPVSTDQHLRLYTRCWGIALASIGALCSSHRPANVRYRNFRPQKAGCDRLNVKATV